MRAISLILIMGVAISLTVTVWGAEATPPKWFASVAIDVWSGDEKEEKAFADTVKSFLSRELRSLGDIEVVDRENDHNLLLEVTALELSGVNGTKKGYVLVYTLSSSSQKAVDLIIGYYASLEPDPERKKRLTDIATIVSNMNSYEQLYHGFAIGGEANDIRQSCEDIVTGIDITVFQERRKSYKESIEKNNQSNNK